MTFERRDNLQQQRPCAMYGFVLNLWLRQHTQYVILLNTKNATIKASSIVYGEDGSSNTTATVATNGFP